MGTSVHSGSIVILDCGGQYAHLIGNRVRRLGAFSEIREAETPAAEFKDAAGIILSGGPQSVYDKGSPQADPKIFDLTIPILGICYGHQWIAHALGGEVKPGKTKEYGSTSITTIGFGSLFEGLPTELTVWMSHGDTVTKLPDGFHVTASSPDCEIAAMEDAKRKIFGTQFHLEVTHTSKGMEILKNFVDLCHPAPWSVEDFTKHIGDQVNRDVGNRKVFMLVSGGVDSTVAFTLLEKTLGKDRVYGLLVDTGLMRKDEVKQIQGALSKLGFDNLHVEDASDLFFSRLEDVYDPEEKRRVIGQAFLEVQRSVAKKLGLGMERVEARRSPTCPPKLEERRGKGEAGWILGQGTIYPDTIETGGTKHADRIKTHHNRVEEIQRMIEQGRVIEPLKDLYKDEVRKLGEMLGLPHDSVWRHPFPGPGLGVRILCAKHPVMLRSPAPPFPTRGISDETAPLRHPEVRGRASRASKERGAPPPIGPEAFRAEWQGDVWDGASRSTKFGMLFPYAVLPLKSVGVQGDGRTYRHALVLFPDTPILRSPDTLWDDLWKLATEIPNNHRDFNRVLLCTSHADPVEIVLTPSSITLERANLLREADAIVDQEVRKAGLYDQIWQFPVVLLPVGIKSGGQSIVLRPVDSTEAMTANATRLPREFLATVTKRLLKLPGIDLVFYDLTSKPPATIEWE